MLDDVNTSFLRVQSKDGTNMKLVNLNNVSEFVPNDKGTFDVYGEKKFKDGKTDSKICLGETIFDKKSMKFTLNVIG